MEQELEFMRDYAAVFAIAKMDKAPARSGHHSGKFRTLITALVACAALFPAMAHAKDDLVFFRTYKPMTVCTDKSNTSCRVVEKGAEMQVDHWDGDRACVLPTFVMSASSKCEWIKDPVR